MRRIECIAPQTTTLYALFRRTDGSGAVKECSLQVLLWCVTDEGTTAVALVDTGGTMRMVDESPLFCGFSTKPRGNPAGLAEVFDAHTAGEGGSNP